MDGKDFPGALYPGKIKAKMVAILGVLTGRSLLHAHVALGVTDTNVGVQFSKRIFQIYTVKCL